MSKSDRTIEQKINIMKAKKSGADIIACPDFHNTWEVIENPQFNWGLADYKVQVDYADVFGQAVNSIDYTNLSNQISYLERGEKLQNIVDYSIGILNKSKDTIKTTLDEKLPILFQSGNEINQKSLEGTTVLLRLKENLTETYYTKAIEETNKDPSLLEPFGGNIDEYVKATYGTTIETEINKILGELNLRVKGITSEVAVATTSQIVDDAISSVIYEQTQTPEETLYDNKAKKAEQLRNDVAATMVEAIKKYEEAPDLSYVFQNQDGISVTIRKQLSKEAPAININYGLEAYSLHGNDCPQVGWNFDEEDKVFNVTGATEEFVKLNADNVSQFLDDKLHVEENTRKAEDLWLKRYIDNTFSGHLEAINATYEAEKNERILAQETINNLILNMNNASEKEDQLIKADLAKLIKEEADARTEADAALKVEIGEKIAQDLQAEVTRATQADNELKEKIDSDISVKLDNMSKDIADNIKPSIDAKLPLAGGTMSGDILIAHATTADMSSATTNPSISFAEIGSDGKMYQKVSLVYTDYDDYRFPAGLKVIGNGSNPDGTSSPAWFDVEGDIYAAAVHNAVWNDLTDLIVVPDDTKLEYGRCYITDGENYSFSSKYCQKGIIGIHSDTSGLSMGEIRNKTQLHIAVAGFVLAYVDKVYESGTPLTCGKNGCLTEIKTRDKVKYPERIVGTFWKPEKESTWHNLPVNGRCWIKVR